MTNAGPTLPVLQPSLISFSSPFSAAVNDRDGCSLVSEIRFARLLSVQPITKTEGPVHEPDAAKNEQV
jgi:hypothetical protein